MVNNDSKPVGRGKLSVIIPAYNESENITNTLNECISSLGRINPEIIVVDDGSDDGTHIKAEEFAKQHNNIKIIRYNENQGKGFAIKHGFESATGNLIALMDADMNIHPKLIIRFLQYMDETGADVVVGSKRHPSSKVDYPFTRKILSDIYYLFVKTLFSIPVKDTQVGLKLYKRDVLEDVLPKVLVKKYAFDIEILSNAIRMGYNITSAPVEISMCFNNHINYKAIWYMLIDTCAVFYRMNILHYYDKPINDRKHYNEITPDFPGDAASTGNNTPLGYTGNTGIIGERALLGLPDENNYEDNNPKTQYNDEPIPKKNHTPMNYNENNGRLKIK